MGRSVYFIGLLMIVGLLPGTLPVSAQSGEEYEAPPPPFGAPDPDRPVGLTVQADQVETGYVLISPIQSKEILLLANDGRMINKWDSDYYLGASSYLLDNGNVLRTVSIPDNPFGFDGQWGFVSGGLQEQTWNGELVWSFELYSDEIIGHHDIEILPNGNILWILFERFSADEAVATGYNPELLPEEGEIWSEKIVEIDRDSGEIIWEWRLWDHLIQDFDETAANFGVVADYPQRVDMNYMDDFVSPQPNRWHINAIDYNPDLDQIALSPRTYSEIWIIDRGISTTDAQGTAGDLMYRWGNPTTVRLEASPEDRIYFQHDVQWIPDGYPGAGNLLIFDNGGPQRPYSRVLEIAPEVDSDGRYVSQSAEVVWEYAADPLQDFYSQFISGAQRQPNGNTLITEGLNGRIFEVNQAGEIVWEYYLPPAMWAFRAERYNLPVFAEFDLTQNLGFDGGIIWYSDCVDGTQARLHEYIPQEGDAMQLFIDTHEDQAEEQWQSEACEPHGGLAQNS
ncbi:MAG: aryl-sulfate sulfotransferase [Anaerolineae bacterium]